MMNAVISEFVPYFGYSNNLPVFSLVLRTKRYCEIDDLRVIGYHTNAGD